MKKRVSAFIAVFILLITSLLPVNAASASLGDVDGNNEITAADARLALRASVGLEKLSEDKKKAADADKNGSITAADARLILRASVGLEELDTTTPESRGYYKAGEIWSVKNNWDFTITGSRTHELCNKYSNKDHNLTDEQVVIISYAYKNTGYENGEDTLYMDLYNVYDEKGEKAILYGCTHYEDPSALIVGTNCTAEAAFALKNKSNTITVKCSDYAGGEEYEATYKINVNEKKSAPTAKLEMSSSQLNALPGIDSRWTEKGKCEIAITNIDVHNLCNSVSNKIEGYTNEQVVNITYNFRNLGIDDDIYISLYNVYDEKGTAANLYACTHTDSPDSCNIGESSTGQESFVLKNKSNFVLVWIEYYDPADYTSYYKTFRLNIK